MSTTPSERAIQTLELLRKLQLGHRGGSGKGVGVTVMRLGNGYVVCQGSNFAESCVYQTWDDMVEALHAVLHPDLKKGN